MTVHSEPLPFDPKILESIADIICGDDTSPYYRSGWELSRFFVASGWAWVGTVEGGRRTWVVEQLTDRRADAASLNRLLCRLVDPREYLDDEEACAAVLNEVNSLLAMEGYELYYAPDGPDLRRRTRSFHRMNSETPVKLTADLGRLVSNQQFGSLLRSRLDEAHQCWDHGAHLAAVIMLGSLLEGVLLDFARNRKGSKVNDNLSALITLAGTEGWLAKDVVDYAHVLRNHRNLIHPNKQHTDGHSPDTDTVRISWNVVVAAINDLAGVAPEAEALRPSE